MHPWQKETLGLKVGDWIIWKDEAIELEGQPAVVTPGMKAMADALALMERSTWCLGRSRRQLSLTDRLQV